MDFASKSLQIGRRFRNMGRLAQIANVFARHGLWTLAEGLGMKSALTPEQIRVAEELSREEAGGDAPMQVEEVKGLPARLRLSFEELGPAFVKMGQVLATREDLLPKEYTEELSRLHSSVMSLPFTTIRQVLDDQLGAVKLKAFASINEKPLAAGSVAQVHEATLVTGERVVVKVQRPGIESQIKVDLSLMEELAQLIERFVPESRVARPTAMVQEFSRAFQGELDFIREAGNIAKITRNFAKVEHIHIPKVFWHLTTGKVLTQSYVDGLPASAKDRIIGSGLSPSLLVERGLGMFLKMVFVDGLFHGDLHPGNLLALPENVVGVIDFGLCVHLGKSTREHLAGLLIGLIQEDFSRVVTHYVELSHPAASFDAVVFEHEVGNAVAPFIGLSLEDLRSGRLFWDLARVAAKHGAPMPQELVVFIKTLISFEGIGTHLDPGFDVLKTAEKFTAEIVSDIYSSENLKRQALTVAHDVGQLARHGPQQIRRLLKSALQGDLVLNVRSEDVGRLAGALERAASRLAVSVVVAALLVGSSILTFPHSGEGFHLQTMPVIGTVGFALAGLLGIYVVVSSMRGK